MVDASQAIAIPKDLALESAALIACGVLTGFGAVVNTAGVKAGSNVVVIGCGGVGLNAIQGARISGCALIIAVDVEPASSPPPANSARPIRSMRKARTCSRASPS